MSIRQVARECGLSRKTIRKMLAYSVPPGYERKKPVLRPKLGAVAGHHRPDSGGRQVAAEETAAHGKADQGSAQGRAQLLWRLHDRKDYVREARLRHKEVFVPLLHPPGDAQVDFGEALVAIGGVEQKAHFLCMDLPQSDDCFVVAFPPGCVSAAPMEPKMLG